MKKSDLKTGMLVKTMNNRFYLILVIDGEPLFANVNGGSYASGYREDLTNENDSDYDVRLIYSRSGFTLDDLKSTYVASRDILWKREEPKEMTIEEIQQSLGYKIKVVESK
jgi:hypothetical protein